MAEHPPPTIPELQAYEIRLQYILSGFRKYRLLSADVQFQADVETAIDECLALLDAVNALQSLLNAMPKALHVLFASKYPDFPRIAVSPAIKHIFDENEDKLDAANDQVDIKAPPATHMEVTFTITDQN